MNHVKYCQSHPSTDVRPSLAKKTMTSNHWGWSGCGAEMAEEPNLWAEVSIAMRAGDAGGGGGGGAGLSTNTP